MIDWDRVIELRDEVGSEDFDEVADLFLEEVDEVINRLRDGTSSQSIEDDLHFLKGSALNLGFRSMAILCQQGEKAASSGQGDSFALQALLTTYDTSREEFLKKQAEFIS